MYHKTVSIIESLLQEHDILYKKFEHEPVRTSEEAAAARPEYNLSQGAKALICQLLLSLNRFPQFVRNVFVNASGVW